MNFLYRSFQDLITCLYLAGWALLHSAYNRLHGQVDQDIRAVVVKSYVVAIKSDHAEVRHDSAAACKSQRLRQTRINGGNPNIFITGPNLLVVGCKDKSLWLIELTGALPLGAAGVGVDEDGQAQQTALRLGGVEVAVERRVVKEQLPVETDQLGALINAVGVRRLQPQSCSALHKSDAR